MGAPLRYANLPEASRHAVEEALGAENPRVKALIKTATDMLDEEDEAVLGEFLAGDGFARFLRSRKKISSTRFSTTLRRLFRRVSAGIDTSILDNVARAMASKEYRAVERVFFRVPVDRDAYELFESACIGVGEQKPDLLGDYLSFYNSESWATLRGSWSYDLDLYRLIMERLTGLFLGSGDGELLRQHASFLSEPAVIRFQEACELAGKKHEFMENLTTLIFSRRDTRTIEKCFVTLNRHYRRSSPPGEAMESKVYRRLVSAWNFFTVADDDGAALFRDFLEMYGSFSDEFHTFVWDLIFELPEDRIAKGMTVFTSTAFRSLAGYYGHEIKTLQFLVKNILSALLEIEIEEFSGVLFQIVMKLLLGIKVDRAFMRRRAEFFAYLKQQSASTRLEVQVIRYLFFEYIYIALKLVENTPLTKISHFCDDDHRYFVAMVDGVYSNKFLMRARRELDPFYSVLANMRRVMWSGLAEKFQRYTYKLQELRNVAEEMNIEDAMVAALEDTEENHLPFYHAAFFGVYYHDPEMIAEAVLPDYWCRVTFEMASPYCYGVLTPLVGTMELQAVDGGARTNGRTIQLPKSISYFRDMPDPLESNRNLTSYIALTLHEAGHILGGTFHFNYSAYLAKLERPRLFFSIFNNFEDFRIEAFMTRIRAHHQVEDLLRVTNEFYTMDMAALDLPTGYRFLTYIFDEAGGYNEMAKKIPRYVETIDRIMERDLNSGRFHSLRELADYGVERLRNIDVANPLAAVPLAREFYEIMRYWPEPDLDGMDEQTRGPYAREEGSFGSGNPEPLGEEELQQLYRQYNDDPESFLRGQGLPVFPELLGKDADEDIATRELSQQADAMADLQEVTRFDYSVEGTIDFSTRTSADDLAAQRQIEGKAKKKASFSLEELSRLLSGNKKKKKPSHKPRKGKKKFVYGIDSRTGSRTKLAEIKEYLITGRDREYMLRFRQWEHLVNKVLHQLSRIMPTIEDRFDMSREDGEINIERIVEVLSDRHSREDMPEIFDLVTEGSRSLEVVIGLDASGSTGMSINFGTEVENPLENTILDIEKAFAMIFGRAISHLTDRVSYYAFNSVTSTSVYRAATVDAVSSFAADASNRDGDFIRYIGEKLLRSPAEVRYFFLISDGQPASDNYSGKEALDDTLMAMREVKNSGVQLIYFNCDAIKGEYYDAFAREATWARHFSDPAEMLPVIPEMVETVVKAIS